MKMGDRVMTKDCGSGVIVGKDLPFNNAGDFRYVVDLDDKSQWVFYSSKKDTHPRFFQQELSVMERTK